MYVTLHAKNVKLMINHWLHEQYEARASYLLLTCQHIIGQEYWMDQAAQKNF